MTKKIHNKKITLILLKLKRTIKINTLITVYGIRITLSKAIRYIFKNLYSDIKNYKILQVKI